MHRQASSEEFRRQVFSVIDHIQAEIQRLFGESNNTIMNGISAQSPNLPNFLSEEVLLHYAWLYDCSTEDFVNEPKNCRCTIERRTEIELMLQLCGYVRVL